MKNMGDGRRLARVELEVQRIVAQYLNNHLKGEIDGILTVTQVKMPADLRGARVYVSALNYKGEIPKLIKELQSWAPEIQRYLGDNLKMRYCPKITFFQDDMTEKVLKIEGILKDISAQKNSECTQKDSTEDNE